MAEIMVVYPFIYGGFIDPQVVQDFFHQQYGHKCLLNSSCFLLKLLAGLG